jgi:putative peptide zinc metalloprotease protein
VVSSENLALALNYECDTCIAFASAYQWLLTTDGPVHLTAGGNQRIAELRKRLHDLANADLTIDQLRAELDEIRDEVADILATELVPAGKQENPPPPPPQTTTAATTTTPASTTEPTTTEGSTTTTP